LLLSGKRKIWIWMDQGGQLNGETEAGRSFVNIKFESKKRYHGKGCEKERTRNDTYKEERVREERVQENDAPNRSAKP
jgi:hypothetical protein